MKLANQIAHNIKRLRQEKGISQSGLADLCDVSRATMNRWESPEDGGVAKMAVENLELLAEKLGVSVQKLLGFETQNSAPEMSVSLSPVLYQALFLLNSMSESARTRAIEWLKLEAGVIDDQARAELSRRRSGT